jgi:ferrochelatase
VNGAVVMAYGTPRRRDDIAAYYTDIRRGRPPSADQLADLIRRYDAIGGLSPLIERTEAQRTAIAAALDEQSPGRFDVAFGMRHADPTIEAAVDALADGGAERIIGLALAPHYSSMSVAVYLERAATAAAKRGLPFRGVESWATEPAFVNFLAAAVRRRLARLPAATHVVFTAHSLPSRIHDAGDCYPLEVTATATAVAATAGLRQHGEDWSIGWQSAGRTTEPWLGPDILELIDKLAAHGYAGVLVCPCGFVADHLEVLYDLDVDARVRAEQAGVAFARTDSVNDDPTVMTALARLIVDAAAN